ncbi:MAG: hypothetical protein ABIH26_08650 [Candidatus Eisenbacteria bacterium]
MGPVARLLIILALPLLACGGDSAGPPGDLPPCADQPYADLNLRFGRLADLLYRLDVAQLLLVKGATDRFATTVAEHGSTYSKQEVFDIVTSATEFLSLSDSLSFHIASIRAAADTLDPDLEWRTLLDSWLGSIEETARSGDSLFALLRGRAEAVSGEVAPSETLGVRIALECRARQIAPAFEDLDSFIEAAGDRAWAELLPSFIACGGSSWTNGWFSFVLQAMSSLSEREQPFLGPLSLLRAGQVASAETGWESFEEWAGGGGALRVEASPPPVEGPALALLLPQEAAPRGSHSRSFFAERGITLSGLPAGSYRLLLLLSGARPWPSPPFAVAEGETSVVVPGPSPFSADGCTLEGGVVPTWIIDPSSIEHLSNDYNLSCQTEVWGGRDVVQIDLVEIPGYRVRSVGTFRAVVQCDDRSISGEGEGAVSLLQISATDCTAGEVVPDRFTFRIEGDRRTGTVSLRTRINPEIFLVTVTCPGGPAQEVDITEKVFFDHGWNLLVDTGRHGEAVFPPGANPDSSPVYFSTEIDRVY